MNKYIGYTAIIFLSLTACAKQSSINQYNYQEIGLSALVEYGTVIKVRKVDVIGKNAKAGTTIGAGVGAGAGAYAGSGSGSIWTAAGGALAGALIGNAVAPDSKGIEYVITKENGQTITLVQNANPEDPIIKVGNRVMIQTSGSYQRVFPANTLPKPTKHSEEMIPID